MPSSCWVQRLDGPGGDMSHGMPHDLDPIWAVSSLRSTAGPVQHGELTAPAQPGWRCVSSAAGWNMGGDGLLTDHECVGDLGIGRPSDEVFEKLVLPGGQSGQGQRYDRSLRARCQRHLALRAKVSSSLCTATACSWRASSYPRTRARRPSAPCVGRRPARPQRRGARRKPPAGANRPQRREPQSSANARPTRLRARSRLRTTPTSPTAG
jgi:hypothetical protein